ncbi:diguanylate cyclase domain-containing protein [Saccharothrix obliqua]|uniref:diguanylate cyclase domain-containing protein n=1 Tax=Saccharothrix obliqua TaxID=2861747 RepID=UPI0027E32F92|nr:diguanylate cyclase [Saccharothrix obliqua]
MTPSRDGDGRPSWFVAFQDVTDHHHTAEELLHRTTHDELTGLPNRVLIKTLLTTLLESEDRSRVAVLFCDVDNFKRVNDSLGHDAGDELLVALARRVCSAPLSLVDSAESQAHLLRELDRWVLRTALKEAASWSTPGDQSASAAVNPSGLLPGDPEFEDIVASAIAEAGIPWDRVVLELVETALVDLRFVSGVGNDSSDFARSAPSWPRARCPYQPSADAALAGDGITPRAR